MKPLFFLFYLLISVKSTTITEMKKQVAISEVALNPDNPRAIQDDKFKQLVTSIKSFPEMLEKRPIVVDESMMVLGGNMRLKACEKAGLKKVWIEVAEGWTEAQKKEFIIKDNLSFGEWDWNILSSEWNSEDLNEWGLEVGEQTGDDAKGFEGNFDDEGIGYQTQFGVIVSCGNEEEQESTYNYLIKKGYNCKVVVT